CLGLLICLDWCFRVLGRALSLCVVFRGVPGVAPGGAPTFFVSTKKRRPKKGEPKPGPLRGSLRCSVRSGCAQTRLRLKHARPFFRAPLRCSARPTGQGGTGIGLPLSRDVPSFPHPFGERAGVRGLHPERFLFPSQSLLALRNP